MLIARASCASSLPSLHRISLLTAVREDDTAGASRPCRVERSLRSRYATTIDDPDRFHRSRDRWRNAQAHISRHNTPPGEVSAERQRSPKPCDAAGCVLCSIRRQLALLHALAALSCKAACPVECRGKAWRGLRARRRRRIEETSGAASPPNIGPTGSEFRWNTG